MRPYKIFVPVLITFFLFISENCQSQQFLDDTLKLNEVVITGTRIAVNRNQVPLSVSVVNNEAIEASSESALLPVLSAQVPGMFVTERGITGFGVATGSAGQISMRGIGGSPTTQVLVLLNGNPQYMGLFGHPLPDAYVASDVQRVEVIRGPASVLYGSNAMGGAINIITKQRETNGFGGSARLLYGSYNTQKYMANAGYKGDKFNALVSINHDRTDGHRDSSDFKITNGYAKLGYIINSNFKTSIDFSLAGFTATDPGMDTSNIYPVEVGERIDIVRGMGAFVLDNRFKKIEGSLRLFYNFGEHEITDGFHSNDMNYGLVFYQGLNLFKNNRITLGLDYKQYGGKAENVTYNTNITDTTVYEIAGYGLIQQELFSKLTLNAGLRLNYHEYYGMEPIPSVGFAYSPAITTIIKGSVSKGFRAPTIRELFMWGAANADLEPEEMINYDLSIKEYLLKSRMSAELSVFHANGSNLIKTVYSADGAKNINTGTFNNWGMELALDYKVNKQFSLHTNYSWLYMEDPIIAAPEKKLYVSGTYKNRKLNFNLNMQSVINLYLITGENSLTESYTLLNARVAYQLNKYIQFFIKGQNLTNVKYQINYGYPMPGIIGFGGINLFL